MKKFTIIDYLIILLVICAVIFAFIHITSDDSSNIQKTAFDASTISKIPDTYSNYYKDGYIVNTTIKGFNSSTNEEMTINGTVIWIGNHGGTNVQVLFESNNTTYLAGLYKSVPNADIYIDTISLEVDGSKYDNLVEFKVKPQNITSLNDLTKNLTDTDFEISTTVSLDSVDAIKIQDIKNQINSQDKRFAIHTSGADLDNQIILEKANMKNINDGNTALGNINALTDEITIRVYNCSDSQIENIKNNYDVINIRKV
ncbi:MAG: adhesin [Methanobrevibacter sp.]|uniref:adhesin n=1 Tax=Methanobrevibacter sp. TaxID=66852 RepID=UPI0025F02E91|nr:adhesin [Methanobrevibacter sp.]MBE6509325.1 adhesin [Methanobrevibacter sp.]